MPAPIEVILYGRPGCTLCVEAERMLERIGKRIALHVRNVNIEGDDDLLRRFMFEIPVVEAAGRVLATAPVREGALEDALEALATD